MSCWTQALHEHVLAYPPKGNQEDAVRALLCTPAKTSEAIPMEVAAPLRAWLAQSPPLSCAHALSSALPHTEDFHRLGGPLLAWGLSKPWHADILVQQTLHRWCRVLNERNLYSNALAANMACATHLVAQVLPRLEENTRLALAELWTKDVVEPSPNNVLWQPNMCDAATQASVVASWIDLHTIATTYQGGLGTEKWERAVRRAFDKSFLHHGRHLLTLLQSALPDDAKVRAAFAIDFKAWFDPDVLAHLAPFLQRTAPDPVVRLYSIPWAKDENFQSRSERAEVQKRLCSLYCPELVPLFELCDIDWLDRVNVFRVANALSPDNTAFDVVGLLDIEPTQHLR